MNWLQAKQALKQCQRLRRPHWQNAWFVEALPVQVLDGFGDTVVRFNLRAWNETYGFAPWYPCDDDKRSNDWIVIPTNNP